MSTVVPVARKKLPLVKIAVVLVLLAVGALLLLRGINIREWIDRGMALIRGAGPWVFFGGMLILPAVGAPLLGFMIFAGEAFGGLLTIPGVIAVSFGVVALNLALIYWMARFAIGPLLERWVKQAGYEIPRVTPKTALSVTLLVRLVPGPPYCLQGYMLALAGVPFGMFLGVSLLCLAPWIIAAIILGQGVLNGNFRLVAIGIGVIVATVVTVHLLRRRYAQRKS